MIGIRQTVQVTIQLIVQQTVQVRTHPKNVLRMTRRIHTHTVDTDKGGVGGNEEAEALVEWVRQAHPSLANKARPLTVQQAEWLLHKHTARTLRRIISQVADNPKTSEKEDVYCRIVTFLRWDKTDPPQKRFTYEELCNELTKGVPYELFEVVRSAEGKALYWVRKDMDED